VEPPGRSMRGTRPGGDPGGVDAAGVDALFRLQIRYVIEGIARDLSLETATRRRSRR
jgi:TetR/AcrR family tetracycline transcriptional repressor